MNGKRKMQALSLLIAAAALSAVPVVYAEQIEAEAVLVSIANANSILVQETITVTDADENGVLTVSDALYLLHENCFDGGAENGFLLSEDGVSAKMVWGISETESALCLLNDMPVSSLTDPVSDSDSILVLLNTAAEQPVQTNPETVSTTTETTVSETTISLTQMTTLTSPAATNQSSQSVTTAQTSGSVPFYYYNGNEQNSYGTIKHATQYYDMDGDPGILNPIINNGRDTGNTSYAQPGVSYRDDTTENQYTVLTADAVYTYTNTETESASVITDTQQSVAALTMGEHSVAGILAALFGACAAAIMIVFVRSGRGF